MCPLQIYALGTCTKFQLEILIINVISGIVYFREIIFESLRNVSETTPRTSTDRVLPRFVWKCPVLVKYLYMYLNLYLRNYKLSTKIYCTFNVLWFFCPSKETDLLSTDPRQSSSIVCLKLIEAEWRIYASVNKSPLVQIIACCLAGTKPLSGPMLEYC